MDKIIISTGKTVFRNRIRQEELTVKQLFRRLELPEIRKEKDGPYFVFCSFECKERGSR